MKSMIICGLALGLAACSSTEPPATLGDALPGSDATDGGMGNDGASGMDAADGGAAMDATPPGSDAASGMDAAPPSDGGVPITDMCNPLAQSGCTDAVQTKCIVENSTPHGGAHCIAPDPADKALDQGCTGGDCMAGLTCVRVATSSSACKKICDPVTHTGCESLGTNFECRSHLVDTNWNFCAPLPPTCDPLTQAPCTAAQSCQPFTHADGSFDLRCLTAGTGTEGASCGSAGGGACARGFMCVRQAGTTECHKICAMAMDCPMSAPMCNGTITGLPVMYCN